MVDPTNPPYVLVAVPSRASDDVETLSERVESLREGPVDGVVLDLYRTSRLVSRIHRPDEADALSDRELSKDGFLELYDRFDDRNFDVVGRLYDPETMAWYADETEADLLQLHAGDITYKRLLESVATVPQDVVLGVKATERSTVDRALEWLDGPEGVLLVHEEYETGKPRPDRYRGLSDWNAPRGLVDPTGDPDVTRTVLAGAEGSPALWQPRLSAGEKTAGYTPESVHAVASELKESGLESEESPETPDVDAETWSLTDRDRSYQRDHRRSLMADRHLSAGSTLQPEMVRELRPGNGLPAEEIDTLDGFLIQRPTEPQAMISY